MKKLLLFIALLTGGMTQAQCNLSANFTYVQNGNDITFTSTSTGSPIDGYDWWFNGQFSNATSPTLSLSGANYGDIACLTIYDSTWTCVDSICLPIYFDSTQVSCDLVVDFTYNQSGTMLYCTDMSTGLPLGATFDWWYNGQSSSAQNPNFSTVGAVDGDWLCLTIYDPTWSCWDSICTPVYLDSTGGGCNLTVGFSYVAYGGNIYFTNTSANEPVGASYDWWYGGQSSNSENPVFTAVYGYEWVCLTVYDSIWSCYDSVCYNVFVDSLADSTVTIQEQDAMNFSFYPNPVDDQLFITLNGGLDQVLIFSVTGEMVRRENISAQQVTMDVSGLPSGLYFITVYSDDNPDLILSEKFIKR